MHNFVLQIRNYQKMITEPCFSINMEDCLKSSPQNMSYSTVYYQHLTDSKGLLNTFELMLISAGKQKRIINISQY